MKRLLTAGLLVMILQTATSQTNKILVPFRNGKLWGYSDTLGKIIVKPAYDSVTMVAYDGFVYKGGKEGVVNQAGIVVLPPIYDMIYADFPEEMGYIVTKAGKKGVFSEKGKQVVPILYDTILQNQEEQIIVGSKGKKGMYNQMGKLLVPVQYDEITDAFFDKNVDHSKSIMGRKGEKYWLINKQSGKAVPYDFQFDAPEEVMVQEGIMDEGVQVVEQYGEYSTDRVKKILQADQVTDFQFMTAFGSSGRSEYFLVTKDGQQGLFYKPSGKLIVPVSYDSILYVMQPFYSPYLPKPSQFMIGVKKNGRAGLINEKGDVILPFEYDRIVALARNNSGFELELAGKKGVYLLYTNYPVIPPKYDAVIYEEAIQVNSNWNFSLYRVWYKGQTGFVGENGVEYFK